MFSGRVIAFLSGLMKGSFLCISGRNGLIYPTLISALLTVCFVDLDGFRSQPGFSSSIQAA